MRDRFMTVHTVKGRPLQAGLTSVACLFWFSLAAVPEVVVFVEACGLGCWFGLG